MGRPRSVPYNEIMAKYQTGQYSINQLAKQYNVSKGGLSKYIKNNNVQINEHAQHAINTLNSGFSTLEKMINEHKDDINEHKDDINEHSQKTDLIEYQNNTLIVDEVIKIVKDKNPAFANMFQNVSAKVLKISNELLNNGITDTKDLKNITGAMKDINDTLQVIPKPPAFAQQININKEANNTSKEFVKTIEVEIVSNENTNS